jgi:hypothetical protein
MLLPRLCRLQSALLLPSLERRLPRNANFRDRTGERLTHCTILGFAGILKPSFSAWLCRCDCGKLFIASSNALRRPTIACGCQWKKHGLTGTRILRVWQEMIAKCHDSEHRAYAQHGARGVSVCASGEGR